MDDWPNVQPETDGAVPLTEFDNFSICHCARIRNQQVSARLPNNGASTFLNVTAPPGVAPVQPSPRGGQRAYAERRNRPHRGIRTAWGYHFLRKKAIIKITRS